MRRRVAALFACLLLPSAAACNSGDDTESPADGEEDDGEEDDGDDTSGGDFGDGLGDGAGGDFGATPGGVKDMTFARELLASGQVPPADALLVEAMFAEHDLGLTGPACTTTLCLRAGAGIAPDAVGTSTGWVQIGLSSTVDPETWERPSTTFVMTVDVSGSMSWDYGDPDDTYTSGGQLAEGLLEGLGQVMTERDRVAIVTYGSTVAVPLGLTRGTDPAYAAAVEALHEDGSTNMEAGLVRAYEIAAAAAEDGETEQVRVVLFTDVQPNVGATAPSQFETMAAAGAEQGVGITVLALGLGIGPEVLRSMAHLDGGNAFSLTEQADVETFMADSWPWFTTPIAHDLTVAVEPADGVTVGERYGFPGTEDEPPGLEVSSVFLSKKKGALLFALDGADLDSLGADVSLSYRTPEGETLTEELEARCATGPLDDRGQAFEQPGTAKTVALALLVAGMHAAADVYADAPDEAAAIMQRTHDRFAADAVALADEALAPEVDLSSRMLELILAGAPQGSLYGDGG